MGAKEQWKIQREIYKEWSQKIDDAMASFLLRLPIPMSYEVWRHLHKVKGDWIE